MASSMVSANAAAVRKSRLLFLFGALIVVGFAALFAFWTHKALYVRSATSSVFAKYALDHHVGNASITDDPSGLQSDTCFLHLFAPIPTAKLEAEVMNLAYQYYSLDGGTIMDIEYDAKGQPTLIQADAVYEDSSKTLMMTLNLNGVHKTLSKPVNWAPSVEDSGALPS
jgi:hypothetical protein